ncbi:MAG: aminotransferase class III-fold pyridoxal phosphate-dependent enzyme [Rhodospirillaceae bacterium]|nr:aminotransferase class III-fold pyridoxal phosphate-dependent enzyme [Rhodospirillaceae bacterium]
MDLENSKKYLARAQKVIPSATQTFSKGPNQWARGVSPNYLMKGEGAWVWDVDGNKYLDYLMALGPIILGYGNKRVNDAVKVRVDEGPVFSQMHPLEVEVAEVLVDLIPCAEMVRFAKNGSDATTGAIRAARAFTNRERIAFCGYHGWHDWYIGTTTRDKGVPAAVKELTHTFIYNDIASLENLLATHKNEFAAIIMEPVGVEPPKDGFLENVRELCTKHGTLLIFDEIVSGFRFSLGGAQEYFGVTPDLASFGKAMANGYPLSAIVGRRDVMEIFDEIFFSGTFGGDTIGLAACKATIEEMREKNVIEHNWSYGNKLLASIQSLINENDLADSIKLMGYGVRSIVAFPHKDDKQSLLRRSYFMQECVKRGLLYFCTNIICAKHGDAEMSFTLDVLSEVIKEFANTDKNNNFTEKLYGAPVEQIFRKA